MINNMKFDALPKGKAAEAPVKPENLEIISPEIIRERMANPNDAIYSLIRNAVNLVCKNGPYAFNNPTIKEDLTQDVSLKVFEHADSFNNSNGNYLSAWIYKIARNTFVDIIRKEKYRGEGKTDSLNGSAVGQDQVETLESHLSPNEEEMIRYLDSQVIWDYLKKKLTNQEFGLLELKFKEGLNDSEIANRLKITNQATRVRFSRLLKKVKTIMAGREKLK